MSALEDFARTRGYLIRTGCGPRGDFEPIREFVLSSAHIAEIASDQQTVAQLQARVAELEAALAKAQKLAKYDQYDLPDAEGGQEQAWRDGYQSAVDDLREALA